jgi:hypothetical protein
VWTLYKKEVDIPACHWHHAVAICSFFEMIVFVCQCLMNRHNWPSLWITHHGIMPQPASDVGAYLMGFGMRRLNPHLARQYNWDCFGIAFVQLVVFEMTLG